MGSLAPRSDRGQAEIPAPHVADPFPDFAWDPSDRVALGPAAGGKPAGTWDIWTDLVSFAPVRSARPARRRV